jgi:DNA polymerase I-like protein with 3'-5' exonuclease and polymerase domains
LASQLSNADAVVGFSIKFDIHWVTRSITQINPRLKVWDCQLAEFIYNGQEGSYASLNEVCEKYGLPTKIDLVKQYWEQGISTEDIPLPILREYNDWDVQLTKMLFDVQQRLLSEKQKRLVWLLGEDLKALQSAEFNGIKFDVEKANAKIRDCLEYLYRVECDLAEYLPSDIPSGCWNWDSGDHVSALLYGGTLSFDWATEAEAVYKSGAKKGESYIKKTWHVTETSFPQRFKPVEGSEVKKTRDDPTAITRFYQTDRPTLLRLKTKNPENKRLLSLLRSRADKIKVVEMIQSILNKMEQMNWQDNLVHGQFNQNVAVTGRLSSSAPNLQNAPEEVDELFVSRYAN